MHDPTPLHWKMLKRILRYLMATPSLDLFIKKSTYHTLNVYCDADHGGSTVDRNPPRGLPSFLAQSHLLEFPRTTGCFAFFYWSQMSSSRYRDEWNIMDSVSPDGNWFFGSNSTHPVVGQYWSNVLDGQSDLPHSFTAFGNWIPLCPWPSLQEATGRSVYFYGGPNCWRPDQIRFSTQVSGYALQIDASTSTH